MISNLMVCPYYCGPPLTNKIGALPSITDILITDAFTSQLNLANKDRFVVLMDTVASSGGATTNLQEFRKMDLPVVFKGTGATISDVATGSLLYMVAAATTNSAPNTYNYFTRVRYTDC